MAFDARFFLLPTAALALALLPLPYGYYVFLRLVITVSACFAALVAFRREERVGAIVVVNGLLALLFNPVIPVYLTRELWAPIDMATAAWFALLAYRYRRSADGSAKP